jgi:pilus assembly protein Flp/PilA
MWSVSAEAQSQGAFVVTNEVFKMRKFLNDQSGATAIEYGLIAAAMAVCLLTAMPYITNALTRKFNNIGAALK